jgi:UDP-N-acetylglucosamine 4,6-dehydratase
MSMNEMFKDKTVMITGGSGSWGNELTRQLLEEKAFWIGPDETRPEITAPAKIIIFSRGEIAQVAMQRKFNDKRIEFVIGDVRDKEALRRVFQKPIDYVFHLAALKHVPICENEPIEAVHTNIEGISNVITAVIQSGNVKKFLLVSTDKAVDPVNVYGMTKGIAEKLVLKANCQTDNTEFLCVRAGNVIGTNGSLVPFLIDQIKTRNEITITDRRMTRYFMPIQEAISLLFFAAEEGRGGEIYVMNMPSFYITDLAELLIEEYGNSKTVMKEIGAREGEKLHETLISQHEVRRTYRINNNYHVIYPAVFVNRTIFHMWDHFDLISSTYVDPTTVFSSENSLQSKEYLKQLLQLGGFIK